MTKNNAVGDLAAVAIPLGADGKPDLSKLTPA